MPFTVAHAAAVFPLHKWTGAWLPLAALMIGSMSPDFSYFLPGDPGRTNVHNLAGLLWFCWPVGLAVWAAFVRLLEPSTIALLPEGRRIRIPRSDPEFDFRKLLFASTAVVLGAATHLVWDSFTHANT